MASMYNATYVCNNKTHAACSNNVAKQLGMRIIKTIDDGDCFFDTLATYGWAYHYDALERPHQELRQALVDYMEENMGEVAPYVIVNENEGETIESMIESLREDMVWNNDMGDLLSQIAAKAFQVNIYIYNVDPPEVRRLRANQIPYPGDPVHMLRINDGHYQLLLPQEKAPHVIGSYASAHKKSKKSKAAKSKTAKNSNHSKNGNNGNFVHKLSKAFSMASISNHTHKNHGNQMNHQLIKNSQDLQEYEKITVARLHKVLRSFGISEEEIQMSILSLPKKEQKTAYYYDYYVGLLS
jgi:hypothetical protein